MMTTEKTSRTSAKKGVNSTKETRAQMLSKTTPAAPKKGIATAKKQAAAKQVEPLAQTAQKATTRDSKRIDKQTLRTDVFQKTMARVIVWAKARVKLLVSAAAGVMIVGVGLSIYQVKHNASLQLQGIALSKIEYVLQDESRSEAVRIADAQEQLEGFLKEYPSSVLAPGAWMRLAGLAWRKDDFSMAEKAFSAVRVHRKSEDLLQILAAVGLAKLKVKQNDLEQSAVLLNAMPEGAHAEFKYYHLGQLAVKQEQWAEAKLHFEKVVSLAPTSPLSRYARQSLRYLP